MTPDRGGLEDLWTRLLAGEKLAAEEERRLLEAMSTDPSLRNELLEDECLDGSLAAHLRGREDSEIFVRAFTDRLAAERDSTRFVQRVRKGIGLERRPPRWLFRLLRTRAEARSWRGPAFAAALLAGLILIAVVVSNRPGRTPAGTSSEPPAETSVQAPRPEPIPETAHERPPSRAAEAVRPPTEVTPPPPGPMAEEPRTAPAERPPEPPPVPRPAPPPTATAVAAVNRIRGEAELLSGADRSPLRPAQALIPGQGLATADGEAVLRYPDDTVIEMETGTVLFLDPPAGRTVRISRGTVGAQVPRQPPDRPLKFLTAHAEATVLGTRLTIRVTEEATRLEVAEGRVRLRRLSDGRFVDVPAGHAAVAAAGVPLLSRPIPVDEILLLPDQGRIARGEWRIHEDDRAVSGRALEASRPRTIPQAMTEIRGRTGDFVEFSFSADADRDYWVWVRACCTAASDRLKHDAVALEIFNARLARPSRWKDLPALGLYPFNGYGRRPGYSWAGGDTDEFPEGDGPQTSISVRFLRPGRQALRLHALESPIRVDAIWLSTTQRTPPGPTVKGPGR